MLCSINYTSIKHTNKKPNKVPNRYENCHSSWMHNTWSTGNICIAISHTDDRYLKISISYFYKEARVDFLHCGQEAVSKGVRYLGLHPATLFTTVWPGKLLFWLSVSTGEKWENMCLTGLQWRLNETTDMQLLTQRSPLWWSSMPLFSF